MNEIVHKFLSAGDEFMPKMHLKQPGFTYSVCRPFTKNKERIQKFKETRNMKDIKEDLLLWFINFLIKSQKAVVLIYH